MWLFGCLLGVDIDADKVLCRHTLRERLERVIRRDVSQTDTETSPAAAATAAT